MQKLHGISLFLPVIVIEDHKALGSSITINCLSVVVTKAGFVLCAIIETVGVSLIPASSVNTVLITLSCWLATWPSIRTCHTWIWFLLLYRATGWRHNHTAVSFDFFIDLKGHRCNAVGESSEMQISTGPNPEMKKNALNIGNFIMTLLIWQARAVELLQVLQDLMKRYWNPVPREFAENTSTLLNY